ncbi:tumor susceptibility gene 101 protein-like [Mytilus trossulus]|uniref:tumor susceptibility gene 101 protein-like n=1 Tax=Mytilus trossulus TaxID=6551 RepID=UPI003004A7F2
MGSNAQILKLYLSKYKDADLAKKDILAVFSQYKDLRPSHGPFIFNDGSRKDLVNLDGTIPINYRGNIFNIPIGIFLLDTHPYNPPIVYIKPTNTMVIKQGINVDADGKVDLPYLQDWKYPDSDLLGLIQLLSIVFEEEPPVFARSASRPQLDNVAKPQYPYQEDAGHHSCESTTDRRLLCSECSLNPPEVTIQPCGHLATCESCCRRLKKKHNQCPICNGPIDNVVRSFVPE